MASRGRPHTASSKPFALAGHDDVVEGILVQLDCWSLLSAALVCQALNKVVRTSPTLQLVLREGYYGLSGSLRFDKGVFSKRAPPSKRLDRMVDVFRRWQRGAPVTVHRFGFRTMTMTRYSHGLVVACGSTMTHKSVKWDDEYSFAPRRRDGPDMEFPTMWSVFDVHDLRNVGSNPKDHVPMWTMDPGFQFNDIAISRPENVVLTSRANAAVRQQRNGMLYACLVIDIDCFLLEPTRLKQWKSGHTLPAIRYRKYKGVHFELSFDAPGLRGYTPGDYPCVITIGPNATVMTEVYGFPETQVWNWKTGKQVLGTDVVKDINEITPSGGRGSIAPDVRIVEHPHKLKGLDGMARPTLKFYKMTHTRAVKRGTYTLPPLDKTFVQSSFGIFTDRTTPRLATLHQIATNREGRSQYYTQTLRLDSVFPDVETSRCSDTHHWKFPVNSAVDGLRAVTLEGPVGGSDKTVFLYRIHMSDYRSRKPVLNVDTVHTAPLGCLPAHTAEPKPMPRTRQQTRHRVPGRVHWEHSDAWDEGQAPGQPQKGEILTAWEGTSSGCPRTAVAIKIEEEGVEHVEMDGDHLYISSVGGCEWLG